MLAQPMRLSAPVVYEVNMSQTRRRSLLEAGSGRRELDLQEVLPGTRVGHAMISVGDQVG